MKIGQYLALSSLHLSAAASCTLAVAYCAQLWMLSAISIGIVMVRLAGHIPVIDFRFYAAVGVERAHKIIFNNK